MPHFPSLVVPLPIDALHPFNTVRSPHGGLATLCTERCLVMERLEGTSLLAAQRTQLERQARSIGTTPEQLRREMEAKFKAGQLKRVRTCERMPAPNSSSMRTPCCRRVGALIATNAQSHQRALL